MRYFLFKLKVTITFVVVILVVSFELCHLTFSVTNSTLQLFISSSSPPPPPPDRCPPSLAVAKAVSALPLGTLKHVATSGPLSRAVLDTFLDQYCSSSSGNGGSDTGGDDGVGKTNKKRSVKDATGDTTADTSADSAIQSAFMAAIAEICVDLGDHFIGQHILRKAYEKADVSQKTVFVTALDMAKERLNTSKEVSEVRACDSSYSILQMRIFS